ncbi:ATP synthase subunit I [Thermodesulfobacteriota bacterium]
MDWEILYRDLKTRNWIILLVLSSVSYFTMKSSLTLGIILGGFIIIVNFKVFQHTLRRAFSPNIGMKKGKFSIIAKYYFRLLALGLILYILITKAWIDPVGLAVGLSTVVISIVSLGVSLALKSITREAT